MAIEHGGGSPSAYPIARDVMTYLFDPAKAMAQLEELEKGWGGNVQQRMAARYDAYAAKFGTSAPRAPDEEQTNKEVEADNKPASDPTAAQTDAAPPAPEPDAPAPPAGPQAAGAPAPAASPQPTTGQ